MWLAPLFFKDKYAASAPLFARAYDFLASVPKDKLTPGMRLEIDGNRMFAFVGSYMTEPRAKRRFEAHDVYADVQFLLEGEECIDVAPTEGLAVLEPYDSEKDIVFLENPETYSTLILRPGNAAVFFPEEAHKPGCLITEPTQILKLVVKIQLHP